MFHPIDEMIGIIEMMKWWDFSFAISILVNYHKWWLIPVLCLALGWIQIQEKQDLCDGIFLEG